MNKLFFTVLCLAFILSGCSGSGPSSGPRDYGSLTLTFTPDIPSGEGMQAQTATPDIDMTVAAYDLKGTGPEGVTCEKKGITGATTPVKIDGLQPGEWLFVVEAKNSAGKIIGVGHAEVTVVANKTVSASITVGPPDGTGTLQVNVSWPEKALTAPAVTGTLSLGETKADISFTPGEDGHSAYYENTDLTAGEYTLNIQLQDGGIDVGGATETVWIMAGETTECFRDIPCDSVFVDFDDGTAYNFIDDESGRWSVIDGEYVVARAQSGNWAYSYYGTEFSDFICSVDVKQTSGEIERSSGFGIYFRAQEDNPKSGYTLSIYHTGHWYLAIYDVNGYYVPMSPGEWGRSESEYINTGLGEVNNIKLVCAGPVITIYFNNHLVEWFNDFTYSTGKLGLQLYDDPEEVFGQKTPAGEVFSYDNFTVSSSVEGSAR